MKNNTGSTSGQQADNAGSPQPASNAPDAEGNIIPGQVIDQLLLLTMPM